MKKVVLITVCILSLAFAGSAASTSSLIGKTPVKKEAQVAKKDVKKAPEKKSGKKKAAVNPITPAAPIKK